MADLSFVFLSFPIMMGFLYLALNIFFDEIKKKEILLWIFWNGISQMGFFLSKSAIKIVMGLICICCFERCLSLLKVSCIRKILGIIAYITVLFAIYEIIDNLFLNTFFLDRFIYIYTYLLFLTGIICCCKFIKEKKKINIFYVVTAITPIIMSGFIAFIEFFFFSSDVYVYKICIFALLYESLLIYECFCIIQMKIEKSSERDLKNCKIDFYKEYINIQENTLLEIYNEQCKVKNSVLQIKRLTNNKNYVEANNVLNELMENDFTCLGEISKSGNVLIDSILNAKCLLAQKRNIKCCAKVIVPYKFSYDDSDICIVLGALLDRAVLIVSSLERERFIQIAINYINNNLVIKVRVAVNDEGINNSKNIARHKNFLIKEIQKIVDKYNGIIEIEPDEKTYIISVLLYAQ